MPQLNHLTFPSQIFWLVVCFGVLYLVMTFIALPRVGALLEQRRRRIADDLSQAEKLKSEAAAAVQAYEAELAKAKGEAQGILGDSRTKLAADGAAKRADSESAIAAKIKTAETGITQARDRALGEIDRVAADAASGIVERLLGVAPAGDQAAGAVALVKSGGR